MLCFGETAAQNTTFKVYHIFALSVNRMPLSLCSCHKEKQQVSKIRPADCIMYLKRNQSAIFISNLLEI